MRMVIASISILSRSAAACIFQSTNPPRFPSDQRTRAGAFFTGVTEATR